MESTGPAGSPVPGSESAANNGKHGQADPVRSAILAPSANPIPKPPPPGAPPPPNPKMVSHARRLMQRGVNHYHRGEYDKAESLLKEAITMYPFLPKANLVLGKILLIRGSAERDTAKIESARLMFEMARALNPELREPAVLLELFVAPPD